MTPATVRITVRRRGPARVLAVSGRGPLHAPAVLGD